MSARIDPAAFPFVGGALALAIVAAAAGYPLVAAPFVALAGFFLFFFRDPHRVAPADDDIVVSPADGRVLVAGPAVPESAPPGSWQQVSIFLSPTDVHVNRIPVSGRVTNVSFKAGRFLPAYRHDAGSANERSEIWIDHNGQTIVARQIVGIMARRVVCRVASGAEVNAGDRYGIMKFGSRMDVFVPLTATITVSVGDAVRGGESIIAVLHSEKTVGSRLRTPGSSRSPGPGPGGLKPGA
jgi:phosphatidylserine decarboxylase